MAYPFPVIEGMQGYNNEGDSNSRIGQLTYFSMQGNAFGETSLGELTWDGYSNPNVAIAENLTSITAEFKCQLSTDVKTVFFSADGHVDQCYLKIDGLVGQLSVYFYSNGLPGASQYTLLWASAVGLFGGTSQIHIGFHVDLGPWTGGSAPFTEGSGAFEVKLNGVSVKSASDVATGQSAYINVLRFFSATAGFASLAISETGFLGEGRITVPYFPVSDSVSEWTSSTGAANHTNINKTTQTVTFNSAATTGLEDEYGLFSVDTSLTILCASVKYYMWKSDSGAAGVKFFINVGGTKYYSDEIFLSTTPQWYSWSWQNNPATGVAWTPAALNSITAGYVRTT